MKMLKNKIANSFSRSSVSYDQYARLQHQSARDLAWELEQSTDILGPGPILEIGCGSGRLSEVLVRTFADHDIELLDIAPGMLEQCQRKLNEAGHSLDRVQFRTMDAEKIQDQGKYSLLVSGLTIQWFDNPAQGLVALMNSLQPGGRFLFSFLGQGSFAEWQQQCSRLSIPSTFNPLPDPEHLQEIIEKSSLTVKSWQHQIKITYPTVRDFFISLKKTGATTALGGQRLTAVDLRRLIREWQADCGPEVVMTYNVNYLTGNKK